MSDLLAPFVPALGAALLHFLWQGALIGVLAAMALRLLRDAKPQARYAVACLALAACALAPVATLLAPRAATAFAPLVEAVATPEAFTTAATDASRAMRDLIAPTAGIDPFLPWIVALWAIGTCVLSARMMLGLAWVRRLRNESPLPASAAWQRRADVLAGHFRLRRAVSLHVVDGIDSPVSAGWWRPVVLLPAALVTRLPVDLVEALLAHELAHIRRHDYLVNLLQNAIEAVLFYHPVTWWLSRRIRIEREQIADALAIEVACAPRRLAVALAELSDFQRATPALSLMQAAHGGHLMSRIERLIRPVRRSHPGARIVFPLLGVLAAGLATFAYAQVSHDHDGGSTVLLNPSTDGATDRFALVTRKGVDDDILANIRIGGRDDDLEDVQAAKRRIAGDFLWARRDGREVVITDPAVLAKVHEAWRASEAQAAKMDVLSERMDVHSDKLETLSERMDALADGEDDSPEMRAAERETEKFERAQERFERWQAKLESERDAIDPEANPTRYRELEAELKAAEREQEHLARVQEQHASQMEAQAARMEQRRAPMEQLAREMELASQPMEELGKQMEALGKEHEKLAQQAQRRTREIIGEAMQRNLAKPAPTR